LKPAFQTNCTLSDQHILIKLTYAIALGASKKALEALSILESIPDDILHLDLDFALKEKLLAKTQVEIGLI